MEVAEVGEEPVEVVGVRAREFLVPREGVERPDVREERDVLERSAAERRVREGVVQGVQVEVPPARLLAAELERNLGVERRRDVLLGRRRERAGALLVRRACVPQARVERGVRRVLARGTHPRELLAHRAVLVRVRRAKALRLAHHLVQRAVHAMRLREARLVRHRLRLELRSDRALQALHALVRRARLLERGGRHRRRETRRGDARAARERHGRSRRSAQTLDRDDEMPRLIFSARANEQARRAS